MGTLDDAIRQHLDLKRRRGATDSELQRLEDEAFGPPSRPGEPDFPEHETGSAEQSGNGAVADVSAERDEHEVAEAQTTIYAEPEAAEPELGELDLELDDEGAPAQEPVPSEDPPDAAASEPPIEGLASQTAGEAEARVGREVVGVPHGRFEIFVSARFYPDPRTAR